MNKACQFNQIFCDGECRNDNTLTRCDGIRDCLDGMDEMNCVYDQEVSPHPDIFPGDVYYTDSQVTTSIVLPTIIACCVLVALMLLGIKKCKQWELDRIGEMRRSRRIVQRLTARLREKNFNTLQKARDLRKRAQLAQKVADEQQRHETTVQEDNVRHPLLGASTSSAVPPPVYDSTTGPVSTGTSPPPTYEETLLEEFFRECQPPSERSSVSSGSASGSGSGTASRWIQRFRERRRS